MPAALRYYWLFAVKVLCNGSLNIYSIGSVTMNGK